MKNYVKKEIKENGDILYFNKKGQYHRLDGPALEYKNGDEFWLINGIYHRIDGPAFSNSRCKYWYINGLQHREDGPAVEYKDGRKLWYLDGKEYMKIEFLFKAMYKEKYKYNI